MKVSSIRKLMIAGGAAAVALAGACTRTGETASPGADEAADADGAAHSGESTAAGTQHEALAGILSMPHRSDDNRARDAERHPVETLEFFGVQPTHTVVELWPGGGWYTEILAPYLKARGQLVVTAFDPNGPEEYYGTKQARTMQERFATQADVFGTPKIVTVPADVEIEGGKVKKVDAKPFELAPEGTVDVVLTFRNSHGWYRNDHQELIYGAAFKALAPGGVFGVVQHRAPEGADPKETAPEGYLPEETVIEAAKAVGFELVEKSEINANAKDTKDHPDGVWSLPPSLSGKDEDKDKYRAIGESDRMTLKFVKPS
jgi:predicted methyltransferase